MKAILKMEMAAAEMLYSGEEEETESVDTINDLYNPRSSLKSALLVSFALKMRKVMF